MIKKITVNMAAILSLFANPLLASDLSGVGIDEALKSGGYVIYLRHAKTDVERADKSPVDIGDCTTQRPLSDAGRAHAADIGTHFASHGIKVGQVLSSPYCRAVDTAALAFPNADRKADKALHYSLDLSKDVAATTADDLKKLLATKPNPGTNIVLVGHTSNLKEAAGVWPKQEGAAVVFRPNGNTFELVGTIDAVTLSARN